jgi:ABC-type branched-subunit amino acid transport system substrate-binding protein
MKAHYARGLGVLALAGALAGTIGGSAAARPDAFAAPAAGFTLTVGTTLSLTGDGAVFGPAFQKSAEMAVDLANKALARDGVTDITVKIASADDGSTPTSAVNAARKLIGDGATCIAGSIQSASTIAIANGAAVPAGVAQIAPASTSAVITDLEDNGLVFRIAPSDVLQGPVLAAAMQREIGKGKTVSFAARNDAFGSGLIKATEAAWKKLGGKETHGPVLYDPGAASYDSEAQQIVAGNPDAFVILDFPATYAKVGSALLRTGKFDATKMFVGGGQPATIPSFVPKDSMEGARGTRPAVPIGAPLTRAFDSMYDAAPGNAPRQSLDVNEFDAAMTCILASIAAKSNSGKAIAAKLRAISGPPGEKYTFLQLPAAIKALRAGKDINYEGVAGSIDWDENGDPASATYDFYKYINSTLTVQRQYRNLHGRILSLDLTPPTTPVVVGKRIWTERHVVFKLRSSDPGNVSPPVQILCAFDKQKLHNCGKSASATLRRGNHVVRAVAIDAQDNRSKTNVVKFKIVKTK